MAILLLLLGALLQQRVASIEGIVTEAGTSQPVARAVVELSGAGPEPAVAITGADGRFEFRNVAAGRYRLTSTRQGYLDGKYGQRGPNGSGIVLPVDAGQNLKNVRLVIMATGAISGRVFDRNGEPLANVPVQAFKYAYQDGERTLTSLKIDQTNDRGEYRLFWLPPGQYYISATPASSQGLGAFTVSGAGVRGIRIDPHGVVQNGDRSAADRVGEADVPVYYPGTPEAQSATPVGVRPGSDTNGVDFVLSRVKTQRIQGITVQDSATGQRVSSANVVLVPRSSSISHLYLAQASDGMYEIKGVIPGSYFLIATVRSSVRGIVEAKRGRVQLEVGASDVSGVTIPILPTFELRGAVTFEGGREIKNDGFYSVVELKNEVPLPGSSGTFVASFSGSQQFTIDDVVEGDYQVRLSNLPESTYVKSVRYGGLDVLNGILHLDARAADRLEVVLATNPGMLTGLVVTKNGEPLANTAVALVPDAAHRQRADLYRSTYTDEAGRFQLKGISPGSYSAFAWEDIEDGLWRDPDFIRRVESAGRPIRVVEGGGENIQLVAIPFAF